MTDKKVEECLELFGIHFVKYCQDKGYDTLLKTLGANFHDFLQNLDNLHDHLGTIYPGMRAPFFRVIKAGEDKLHLYYYSERKGLTPIVIGILKALGKDFYKLNVSINVSRDSNDDYQILEIFTKSSDNKLKHSNKHCELTKYHNLSDNPKHSLVPLKTFCEIFPFHVLFQNDLRIIQFGKRIFRLTQQFCSTRNQVFFSDLFVIVRPKMTPSFLSIFNSRHTVFVVKLKNQVLEEANKVCQAELSLKGQMISVPESNAILFQCFPKIIKVDDFNKLGLFLSDLPIYDKSRDIFLASHIRKGERELVDKIDNANNQLKVLENQLRQENIKNQNILENLFPPKIACLLCQKKTVYPQFYKLVTILFADIVGFTAICGDKNINLMEIFCLLNDLFLQFDNLTNQYDVYKIETIGDGYVIVGGLPNPIPDHADKVVLIGLEMIEISKTMFVPGKDEPIQVRLFLPLIHKAMKI